MSAGPRRTCAAWVGTCLLLLFPGLIAAAPLTNAATALQTYVSTPDPAYRYALQRTERGKGYSLYLLKLVSQRWRSRKEVDRRLWTHWLVLAVPEKVRFETAFLIVAAGSSQNDPHVRNDRDIATAAEIALKTGSVAAVLQQVPNQPLVFADEPWPHAEDALVAYSWDKAMKTGDLGWPVNLPMVKAVVRAMDATQSFLRARPEKPVVITRFVLHGESKRAAAVWLTAAIDPRVRAIAPAVFDFLNFPVQAEHHFRVYGFFSAAARDYVNYDILRRLRTPEGEALARVVDPYSYRDRLTMPKLVIQATGDQFFPPDASRFYWDGLRGEKLLQAIPNTDHRLERPAVFSAAKRHLIAWYASILESKPRPSIDWHLDKGGALVARSSQAPIFATLWMATNLFSRDFRWDPLRALWLPWSAGKRDDRTFVANVNAPLFGWRAYLVQLGFTSPIPGYTQVYTTQVLVTPDSLPFRISERIDHLRDARSWLADLRAAGAGEPAAKGLGAKVDMALPIPLLGRHVDTRAGALALLEGMGKSPARNAMGECLAVRLNIAAGALGWYSRPKASGPYVWELWGEVRHAFLSGDPVKSARICSGMNQR